MLHFRLTAPAYPPNPAAGSLLVYSFYRPSLAATIRRSILSTSRLREGCFSLSGLRNIQQINARRAGMARTKGVGTATHWANHDALLLFTCVARVAKSAACRRARLRVFLLPKTPSNGSKATRASPRNFGKDPPASTASFLPPMFPSFIRLIGNFERFKTTLYRERQIIARSASIRCSHNGIIIWGPANTSWGQAGGVSRVGVG